MPRVRVVAHPVFARDSDPEGWRGWLAAGQRVFGEYNKFLVAWLRCLISAHRRRRQHRSSAPIARDRGKRLAATSKGSAGIGWAGTPAFAGVQFRVLFFDGAAGRARPAAAAGAAADGGALRPVLGALRPGSPPGDCRPRLRDSRPRQYSARAVHRRDEASIGLGHADPARRAGRSGGRAETRAAWVPFYGWYASRAGSIAIDRGGRAAALRRMVARARAAAAEGRPIVIFPEGTRTAPGRHLPYQPGVAALYQTLRCRWCRRRSIPGCSGGAAVSEAPRADHAGISRPDPAGPAAPPADAGTGTRIETATAALEREAGYGCRAVGNQSSPSLPRICSSE